MPRLEGMGITGRRNRQTLKPWGRISLGTRNSNCVANMIGTSVCIAGTMSRSKCDRIHWGSFSPNVRCGSGSQDMSVSGGKPVREPE